MLQAIKLKKIKKLDNMEKSNSKVNIQYPTKELLEAFLKNVYKVGNLDINTDNLWKKTEEFGKNYSGKVLTLSQVPVNTITGIDLPVLLSRDGINNKGTIAIIAQDPLRSKNDKMLQGVNKNNPIIGTPFALHYKQEAYPQTEVYRRIINGFLDNGYNIYITDAHKIYPRMKQIKEKEIELLKNEIIVIQPKFIVTFGTAAKDYVEYIEENKLHLLHPSQTNWDHWKQWIFEQAYYRSSLYEVDWAKYARQIGCRDDMFGDYNREKSMHEIIAEITIDMLKGKGF